MSIFVDTSAILAILNPNDANHLVARQIWTRLVIEKVPATTTNYVLLESFALVQNRVGLTAIRALHDGMVPLLQLIWVTLELHQAAVTGLLIANQRALSLVDCTSFEAVRRFGITACFAFDRHFIEQGFTCLTQ
ncbi:MAG: PIN domain-containing protein [Chloroflexi bacterium]|nr:PIN domain-containing protein [Chloroflexota bacterium]